MSAFDPDPAVLRRCEQHLAVAQRITRCGTWELELGDLTDIDALEAAIAAVRARTGPIAALLNNAANDQRHSIVETTSERWDAGVAAHRVQWPLGELAAALQR